MSTDSCSFRMREVSSSRKQSCLALLNSRRQLFLTVSVPCSRSPNGCIHSISSCCARPLIMASTAAFSNAVQEACPVFSRLSWLVLSSLLCGCMLHKSMMYMMYLPMPGKVPARFVALSSFPCLQPIIVSEHYFLCHGRRIWHISRPFPARCQTGAAPVPER
jgi:hypothetical protein